MVAIVGIHPQGNFFLCFTFDSIRRDGLQYKGGMMIVV